MPKFIDIGANMVDTMFRGVYRGKSKHPDDLMAVLERAQNAGVTGMLVTAGNLEEAEQAVKFCRDYSTDQLQLKCTVGVHPTRCQDFYKESASHKHDHETPESYLNALVKIITDNPDVVGAIGECGVDNDRLHFCPSDKQIEGFKRQIPLSKELNLPLFLHTRNSPNEFFSSFEGLNIRDYWGVVHSFTGPEEELLRILDETNFYIGINGCSLKTEENLQVAAKIPIDRLLLETDCPWCGIKNTHASKKHVKTTIEASKKFKEGVCVKDRTEPCHIIQVAEVMAELLQMDLEALCDQVYENTKHLFSTF